jgi:transcriptional regulator with XRE-family HTH domain
MNCADTIKKIRTKLNLDQKDFAEKLKLSKTAIYNYETGIRKPKRSVVFKIKEFALSQGIKVTIDELMT